MTARTPADCAALARALMEQADRALASGDATVGGMTYDRLVAAADVWATLSLRPEPIEVYTATLDTTAAPRLQVGSRVVLGHYDAKRGVLKLGAEGVGTCVRHGDDGQGDDPTFYVHWDDLNSETVAKSSELVAIALP